MFIQNQSDSEIKRREYRAGLRATRLSVGLAAALMLSAPVAAGIEPRGDGPVIVVENCNTGGDGSLHRIVNEAPEDATIDLTALTCSVITLGDGSVSSGEISVDQDDLSIVGPGAEELAITGGMTQGYPAGRVFKHRGEGVLSIEGLTIADGEYTDHVTGPPVGGCIYSRGSVSLEHSVVTGCRVSGSGEYVAGGGVYAKGNIVTKYSTITNNLAINEEAGDDRVSGGGLYAIGGVRVKYSTIADNATVAPLGPGSDKYAGAGQGGGIFAFGDSYIIGSTISSNVAAAGGGAFFFALGANTAQIWNSTISGNYASANVAGVFSRGVDLEVSNSTVAFNLANDSEINGHFAFAGVHVRLADADVQSSIIANNYSSGAANSDFSSYGSTNVITGADNLVITSTHAVGAVTSDDPKLLPLAFNGGRSLKTHALAADSPAIDLGNNVLNLNADQRGPGYPRVIGAAADIGAFERQGPLDGDRIFANGFE